MKVYSSCSMLPTHSPRIIILLFLVQSPVHICFTTRMQILFIVEPVLDYGDIAMTVQLFTLPKPNNFFFSFTQLPALLSLCSSKTHPQNYNTPLNTVLFSMLSDESDDHQFSGFSWVIPSTCFSPYPLVLLPQTSLCFFPGLDPLFLGPHVFFLGLSPLLVKHILLKLPEKRWKEGLLTAKNPTFHFRESCSIAISFKAGAM